MPKPEKNITSLHRAKAEQNVLVLQGGGALGAYQAGAFQRLTEAALGIDWVAGISIGAINAAIICGNPVDRRIEKLKAFWEGVSSSLATTPWMWGPKSRHIFAEFAAAEVMTFGVPGFFTPRLPMSFWPIGDTQPLSVYDTSPLEKTLNDLVDFDYLNEDGPRLSVGAVDVETGNFTYFDSRKTRIDPRHIMASGALPPGFPPVEIDGRFYWDGGLVSNTPLQYVMEHAGGDPMCIFQIDVFSARGAMPEDLADIQQREKDIRFSSRTRLTTDRYSHLHNIRAAAGRLAKKLPKELQTDPDLALLLTTGPECPVTLVHLIHRREGFEGNSKDYEFSRLSMTEHWAAGFADVKRTFSHKAWKSREIGRDGLQVFDLGAIEK
ncbi:patatin-like phospholipase family protein [Pseudorhodobacter sp.]|uniref:patatin-like phospholipase family protein n=1 Tax=Pseudorhodobacter sp. TaxID=1934400 RepID=UPI002648E4DB|nr:patatin-like phospholipase family protein [Pseudorhodobacter sp.]MDN5785850.1 patatin-like phospholipase family protein [Pseudorhodobacter sp.]